jgi:hypothetical protein
MKRALWGLSIAVFLGPTLLPSAAAQPPATCGKLKERKKCLACSESISKRAKATSEDGQTEISVADFIAHFDELKGTRVQVKGFVLMLGRGVVFQQARGDMTALSIDATNVPHDQRRAVVYTCGTGCDATVTGRADMVTMSLDVLPQSIPGIVAESVVVR